ncbi:MAG TPA: hypothetical protein PKV72_00100, partial [Candidatus Peribacteria bacterium]|nr:hypothetical protein [Candidatus Peribacteria bacterium]
AVTLWWQRWGKRAAWSFAASGAGAVVLFLLNGVRIAAIVVVGTYSPELALDLFHGILGAVMVVGMLWLFDRTMLGKG